MSAAPIRSTSYLCWVLDPSVPIGKSSRVIVIRRTVTDEHVAGPFATIRGAERFIADQENALPLEAS